MQVTSGKVKLRLSEKIHRCLFLVALVSELKLSDGLIQINPLQPMSYIILCFNKVHSRKISEVSQTQDRTSNFKIPHRLTLHPDYAKFKLYFNPLVQPVTVVYHFFLFN